MKVYLSNSILFTLIFYERKSNGSIMFYLYVQHFRSVHSCWQSEKGQGVLIKINAGQRIIIIHSGGQERFV